MYKFNIDNMLLFIGVIFIQMNYTMFSFNIDSMYIKELTTILSVVVFLILFIKNGYITIFDVFLILLSLIVCFTSHQSDTIRSIICILAMRSANIDNAVRYYFICMLIVFLICVFLYPIMLLDGYEYQQLGMEIYREGVARHSFLFEHPNAFGRHLLFLYLAYVYINYNKKLINIVGCGIPLYLLLDIIVSSRTAAILVLLTAILIMVDRYSHVLSRIVIKLSLPFSIIVTTTLCYLFYVMYYDIILQVDDLLSGRLSYSILALSVFDITFWGQRMFDLTNGAIINDGKEQSLIVDVSYIYILLRKGILWSITLFILLYRTMIIEANKRKYIRGILLSIICFYGITESAAFDVIVSFPMLFLVDGIEFKSLKKYYFCKNN